MSELNKRILWAFAGLAVTIPVGYVGRVALAQWGLLDPFAMWLGGWLKVHVAPAQAEWTVASLLSLSGYAAFMWLTWRHFKRPTSSSGDGLAFANGMRAEERLDSEIERTVTIPDMPIGDLFFHIRPNLLENAEERRWEAVAREVMDKFSTEQMDAWGRKFNSKTKRSGSFLKIDAEYWHAAARDFIYHFLSEDIEDAKRTADRLRLAHTYCWDSPNDPQYSDLHVNRTQALKHWPSRPTIPKAIETAPKSERKPAALDLSPRAIVGRTRQDVLHIRTQEALERVRLEAARVADFQAWDRVPVLTIREAAHLWAGERPTSDTGQISQMAAVMRSELIEAGNAGRLVVVTLAEPMSGLDLAIRRMEHDQLMMGGASSYYGVVFQDTRVTRENLRAYAQSRGERPLFLFQEDR